MCEQVGRERVILYCMIRHAFSFSVFERKVSLIFESLSAWCSGYKNFKALQRKGYYHGQLMYFCLNQCSDVYLKTCNMPKTMYKYY